jgi:putative hydrolases of HD superfamily
MQEIEKLKMVYRSVYLSNLERKESSAEHSWHLAIFLILLQKEIPSDLNLEKTLKMVLIHDLVEVYAGDTPVMDTIAGYTYDNKIVFDKQKIYEKKEKEFQSATKLFKILPEDLKEEFHILWNEYEERKTVEAKFAKAIDKIQVLLQNSVSQGLDYKEYNSTYSGEINLISKYIDEFPILKEISIGLLDDANLQIYFISS